MPSSDKSLVENRNDLVESTNTLELDDDYKDDHFDSADGKSDADPSLKAAIVGDPVDVQESSIHSEQVPPAVSSRIRSAVSASSSHRNKSIPIEEELIMDEINENMTKSLVIQESMIRLEDEGQAGEQKFDELVLNQQVRSLI